MNKRAPQNSAGPAQVIEARRQRLGLRNGYLRLLFQLALTVLAAWLLATQVFLVVRASGNDMFPAVKDGDLVIAYRLQTEYAKDDVVVYELDGELCIGRIAARETDVVNMDDTGILTVNGTAQEGEIVYPTTPGDVLEYPYVVPEGCVFILDDFRTSCEDSRDFGPVAVEDVRAKVITILRRRGL